LFSLGKQGITDAVLADLPGYGYAAVPKAAKYRWQQVMANYLQTRRNLTGIVLLCDPRLGLTELDEILLDVVRPRVVEEVSGCNHRHDGCFSINLVWYLGLPSLNAKC
jgi:GTP-binding protein